jgi:putative membrane protein
MSDPSAGFFVAGALPLLAAGAGFERGISHRGRVDRPVPEWRHTMFLAGLAAFLLSIEWPFAYWEHHLFSAHQLGIMVARIVAPILIVLSRPGRPMLAGLSPPTRRSLLRFALSRPALSRAWRVIAHPITATFLYVATLYLWELPAMQGDAIGVPAAGLAMHFTLFLTGLLFWARVFEWRPGERSPTHGWRLMMVWIAVLSQILLGAFLTMKSSIFYPAYAASQALGGMTPIADEQAGGFLIWVPSSFLSLAGLVVVIDQWARHETRLDAKRRRWSRSNSAILLYPTTARALREMVKTKNRRLAIGMVAFAGLVFCASFASAITSHRISRRENMRAYWLSRQ